MLAVALACASPLIAGGKKKHKGPYVDGDTLTFALSDLDGTTVRSSDPRFQGKVLLIDLWGTWCPPCLSEIPILVDLQERLGERGLVIVGIAFEDEGEEEALRQTRLRDFVEEQGINYLVLDGRAPRDSDETLVELKNIGGLPVEVLIDRDGTAVAARNGYGYSKRWARKLERELVELLDAPPRAPVSTPAQR